MNSRSLLRFVTEGKVKFGEVEKRKSKKVKETKMAEKANLQISLFALLRFCLLTFSQKKQNHFQPLSKFMHL